jgi:hypothetical protein
MSDVPPPPDVLPYKALAQKREPTVAQSIGLYIAVFCLTGLLLVIGFFVLGLIGIAIVGNRQIH